MRARRGLRLGAVLLSGCVVAVQPSAASANWLSKIVREAGEAGGKGASKLGLGALDGAALHLRSLPPGGSVVSFAAHATPEGHWRFANRAGDVYTAGTADELGRVVTALAPDAADGGQRLSLYLSQESIFADRAMLKQLPEGARLNVVIGKESHPIRWRTDAGVERLLAEVRPGVSVVVSEKAAVKEALFQLERLLDKSRMRTVALVPGGPDTLRATPRFDAATKSALVDEVDPNSLARALASLRGQTAVLTGRIDAGQLKFRPASGGERQIPMAEIERAAAAADVNLVVLQASVTRQPGGRNWLWQKVEVPGLGHALQRATFADFLQALAAERGSFTVVATRTPDGRAILRAVADDAVEPPLTGRVSEWMSEIVSEATGNLVTNAIEVNATGRERQRELDARLLPGIPSLVQFGYIAALVAGLIGLPYARRWWNGLWPREERAEYAGALGYYGARLARGAIFLLLFLPLAGPPAAIASVSMQLWALVTAPWRAIKWLVGAATRKATAPS